MPSKTGMLEGFLKNVRPIELATPGGLFIKRSLGLQTDMVRLRRVVQRVLKGLFYHVKGYRLPDRYEALVLTDESIEKWPKELVGPVLANRSITLGNGVFSYRAAFHKDNPDVSGWIFVFYERASFLGMTLRAGESGVAAAA